MCVGARVLERGRNQGKVTVGCEFAKDCGSTGII